MEFQPHKGLLAALRSLLFDSIITALKQLFNSNSSYSNLRNIIFDLNVRLQDSNEANKYLRDYIKNQRDELDRLKAEHILHNLLKREAAVSRSKLASLKASEAVRNS